MAGIGKNRIHEVIDTLSLRNPFANQEDLPEVERIPDVVCNRRAPVAAQIAAIQRAISNLQYNYLPTTFFNLQKNRPFNRIITTAKEIMAESLPIRCLEATFLALHLTMHLSTVDRIPIAFKSYCNGRNYRHIILAIRYNGVFGAMGISRAEKLMDKPMTYNTLSDLLDDYRISYEGIGHRLVSFKIGLAQEHNSLSKQVPCWRFVSLQAPSDGSSIVENSYLNSLLLRFTEMYPQLSEEYNGLVALPKGFGLLASPATLASPHLGFSPTKTPSSAASASSGAQKQSAYDELEDEVDSDCEENQNRIQCLLSGISPFAALLRRPEQVGGAPEGRRAAMRSGSARVGGFGPSTVAADVRNAQGVPKSQQGQSNRRPEFIKPRVVRTSTAQQQNNISSSLLGSNNDSVVTSTGGGGGSSAAVSSSHKPSLVPMRMPDRTSAMAEEEPSMVGATGSLSSSGGPANHRVPGSINNRPTVNATSTRLLPDLLDETVIEEELLSAEDCSTAPLGGSSGGGGGGSTTIATTIRRHSSGSALRRHLGLPHHHGTNDDVIPEVLETVHSAELCDNDNIDHNTTDGGGGDGGDIDVIIHNTSSSTTSRPKQPHRRTSRGSASGDVMENDTGSGSVMAPHRPSARSCPPIVQRGGHHHHRGSSNSSSSGSGGSQGLQLPPPPAMVIPGHGK